MSVPSLRILGPLASVCWFSGCGSFETEVAIVVERSLGKPPPNWRVTVSPDSLHIAYWGASQGKRAVFLDGVPGTAYAGRVHGRGSGSHNAVELITTIAGEGFMLGYAPHRGDPVFSPDSKSIAYRAVNDGREVIVCNGAEVGSSDRFRSGRWVDTDPVFSPDSRRLAYVLQRDDELVLCIDRKEIGTIPRTSWGPHLAFSPIGTRLAHVGVRGDQTVFVVDGRVRATDETIDHIVFSPNGEHLAYSTDKGSVVFDGRPGRAFDYLQSLVFSPNSRRFAYAAQKGESMFVVIDEQKYGPYGGDAKWPPRPVFSPDSRHVAYSCIQDGRPVIYLDGERVPHARNEDHRPASLLFSPDSRRLAWDADDVWTVLVEDGERRTFAGRRLLFSPDGERIAVVDCSRSNKTVVVVGIAGSAYAAVRSVCFSPDSRRVAYWARVPNGWRIVVDGHEVEGFDRPVPDSMLVFDAPNRFHGLGVRDLEVFYFEVAIR